MTEEEYQAFLRDFDDWNDLFGPIPFWAESRGWQPERCYEVAPADESAALKTWDTGLREVYVTREQRERILKEAKEWVLTADTEEEETLYWHDNDKDSWSSTKEVPDFYKRAVVIKDGHFSGALVNTELYTGIGLSVYRDKECGILFTDGSKSGRTSPSSAAPTTSISPAAPSCATSCKVATRARCASSTQRYIYLF